ncbi:MAG: hypothetical protein L0Y44_04615 [Phycisphaerales bacterium]|nr:hypothetical protein [Phycisphaerales bacterium]MCI0677156.1 hypothetical protein [Phycisphaerales bacterium]
MIFVTVGHQMPFDRLIRAVDAWVQRTGRTDVFAQVGDTAYRPDRFRAVAHLSIDEFRQRMQAATGIVAHAGTGTIIAALQLGKPLLVLPRLSRLGETRNDHQIPTARHFAEAGHILAASDEQDLALKLVDLEAFQPRAMIDGQASAELIHRLREFAFKAPAA